MRRAVIATVIGLLGPTTYESAVAVSPTAHSTYAVGEAAGKSVGPDKVAWYDASRATAATPPAPMAGVGPKDLVVEGLTLNASLLPITLPIPPIRQVTAFTALSFRLPAGATPASLTLKLTGSNTASIAKHLPSGLTPIACPATSTFKSGLQQPAGAAPTYDCSTRSTVGQLTTTGKAVTFPGISRLLTGNTLSVVILPGSLGVERLVFSPPTKTTLSLLSFDTAPPATTPTVPPAPVQGATPPGGSSQPAGVPPIPPVPAITAPAPSASSPVIAPSSPGLATVALAKPDDASDRARALGMLLLLVAGVAWLAVTERSGPKTAPEMGIGRFRSARSGLPPTI